MAEEIKEPVTVVGTRQGTVIEVIENVNDPEWIFHIMLKQGDRYAHMLAKAEFLPDLNYVPGEVLGGRILVIDQMEPFNNSPFDYLKRKKGRLCYKDGKPIYRKAYFTHNKKKQDIIIEED